MLAQASGNVTIDSWQASCDAAACGDLIIRRDAGDVIRIILADACGHGLRAEAIAQDFERIIGHDLDRPIEASTFERWNKALCDKLDGERFVAATLFEIDETWRIIRVWNAGNPAPLLVRDGSNILQPVESFGLPLGAFSHDDYESPKPAILRLDDGDRLLGFSDGLLDQRKGEVFLDDTQVHALMQNASILAQPAIGGLRDCIGNFLDGERPADDVSVIEISRTAAPAEKSAAA